MKNRLNIVFSLFILAILNIRNIFCQIITSIGTGNNIYNFVGNQNYEIDLSYEYLLGTNIYFYSSDNSTLLIMTVDAGLTLEINMKMYTNDTFLIYSIENKFNFYFGFDFNINNSDITLPDFRSDIILCKFNKDSVSCFDYAYGIKSGVYVDNTAGKILKNNLIPLGVNNTSLNILHENVINYKAYYKVHMEKVYSESFDNKTMFQYFHYSAMQLNGSVTVFYGIEHLQDKINKDNTSDPSHYDNFEKGFSLQDSYFAQNLPLVDGNGLSLSGEGIKVRTILALFFVLFLILK